MAKRFTDTTKWKRPWFRALGLHAKVLWQYICDDCDHAGIWIADFDLVSFQVGFKTDDSKLKDWLGDKLVRINGDRFFVPSFLEFQYGAKDNHFRAKVSAYRKLSELGLVDESGSLKDLTNSYLRASEELPNSIGISIGKGKGISNTGSAEGAAALVDYERAYKLYPKKVGKSGGVERLKKLCPMKSDLDAFVTAMGAYVANCKSTDTFFKQFDTFVNSQWRDWLDPSAGSVDGVARKKTTLEVIQEVYDGVAAAGNESDQPA